jgi:serine/threonine-protein kinase
MSRPSASPHARRHAPDDREIAAFRSSSEDALLTFSSEEEAAQKQARRRNRWNFVSLGMTAVLSIMVLIAAGVSLPRTTLSALGRYFRSGPSYELPPAELVPPQGTLSIESQPVGAEVKIDGARRGVTPLQLQLPAGDHAVELLNGSAARSLRVTIPDKGTASQYIEFAPESAPPAASGRLEVTSEPAHARVKVDGVERGTTPLLLSSVQTGRHTVVIAAGGASVTRTVDVSAGSTASVVVSLARGDGAGWIDFRVPLEMKILEGGKVIGTTAADRLMVSAGRHDLVLTNESVDLTVPVTVQVEPGKIAEPNITIPPGSVSINSTPWAEVLIDGKSAGTTPLANLSVALGTHELVYRHPQLGERHQTIVVKAHVPTRIGFAFGK